MKYLSNPFFDKPMINPERIDRSSTCAGAELKMTELLNMTNILKNYDHCLISALEKYDFISAVHSVNTGIETTNLGKALLNSPNYPYKDKIDLNKLKIAGTLHDIGKICIPTEILTSKNKLSEAEFAIMRHHPIYSAKILKQFSPDPDLLMAVLAHHEKIDGSGYPNHLKKNEIPLMAQIITIADVYDALTSDRPYQAKKTPAESISIMKNMEGHFNDEILKIFIESKKPLISPAQSLLDNGRTQSLLAL